MNQFTLKAIFKSMMLTVREYNLEHTLPEEYLELQDALEEIDVTDMIDNIKHVYNLIDKDGYFDDEEEDE